MPWCGVVWCGGGAVPPPGAAVWVPARPSRATKLTCGAAKVSPLGTRTELIAILDRAVGPTINLGPVGGTIWFISTIKYKFCQHKELELIT